MMVGSTRKSRRINHDEDDIAEVITLDPDSDSSSSFEIEGPSTSKRSKQGNGAASNEVCTALTVWMIQDLLPWSTIQTDAFSKFIDFMRPGLSVPAEEKISESINLLYEMECSNVRDLFGEASSVSLAVDCWKSVHNDEYMTVRGHFIDEKWKPQSHVLSTCKINNRLDHMNVQLGEVMRNWALLGKVVSIVVNQSCNVQKVVQIHCLGQKLQHCIETSIQKNGVIRDLIKKCRLMVSHFQHSSGAQLYLKQYQDFLELTSEHLVQYNETDLDSLNAMMESLLAKQSAISAVFNDHDITPRTLAIELHLSENEWELLSEMVKLIKPFQLAKKVISQQQELDSPVSISKPMIDTFSRNFLALDVADNRAISLLKKSIKELLEASYEMHYAKGNEDVTDPDYLDLATYLDPRYKSQTYLNARHKENVRAFIQRKFRLKGGSPKKSRLSNHQSSNALDILFPSTSTADGDAADECMQYDAEPEIEKTSSIHDWWRTNSRKYPQLAEEAKRHLCTPSTARPIDKCIQADAMRVCLPPECVDKAIFLHFHK